MALPRSYGDDLTRTPRLQMGDDRARTMVGADQVDRDRISPLGRIGVLERTGRLLYSMICDQYVDAAERPHSLRDHSLHRSQFLDIRFDRKRMPAGLHDQSCGLGDFIAAAGDAAYRCPRLGIADSDR